jgi:hypothetical protein
MGLNGNIAVTQLNINYFHLNFYTLTVPSNPATRKRSLLKLLTLLLISIPAFVHAQAVTRVDSAKTDSARAKSKREKKIANNVSKQYDFGNLVTAVLHPKKKANVTHSSSGITVVPNVAANPTIGAQAGIKAVAGKKLGPDSTTFLSIAATSASITTKGIIYFYINHNIFTANNKWNFQGNLVVSKTLAPDYGFGIGRDLPASGPSEVLEDPLHKVYPIHSYYFDGREKVYKEVAKDLFLGAGLDFAIRRDMTQKDTVNNGTPMSVYNNQHGLPQSHYASDGFLFDVEYITRDNPNRAYNGIYFDAGVRFNETFIGSTKNAVQFTTDIRKYISLSEENPETVLALWNWGSYLASGVVPYLELPGTARDGTFRSGRGYTTQYFKGTEFNDSEAEFRFPILANKFISGVVFGSMQSGNDEQGTKLFQVFEPGYGGGLRVLFNKVTRTNLALDYAFGRFGNKGFFLNLNEAF